MRTLMAAGLILIQQASPASPSADNRMLFASKLFMATIEARVKAGQDVSGLSIEAMGIHQEILVITDDTDEAKGFFNSLTGDPDTRMGLLRIGFKVAMLVNAKHGTFIYTLTDWGFDKPPVRVA